MSAESRLRELGITVPEAPAAVAAYEPWVQTGSMIITSGQLPFVDGKLAFAGKVGGELTDEQGYEAARICAINAMSQLRAAAGSLDRIRRIVRLEGNVHSAPGFRGHPQVLNGASELFNEVFGERGRHTRTALGINEMPLDAPIQLSVYAELEDGPNFGSAGLAHVTLAVRDVQASSDFFETTLGWSPIRRPGNIGQPASWLAINGSQELHLIEVADFEPSRFEREFGRHIAVQFPLSEFDGIQARLRENGAEIVAPERETPFQRFFFRTPDGYLFEIVEADHAPE